MQAASSRTRAALETKKKKQYINNKQQHTQPNNHHATQKRGSRPQKDSFWSPIQQCKGVLFFR